MYNLDQNDQKILELLGINPSFIERCSCVEFENLIWEKYYTYLENSQNEHSIANTYPTIFCANDTSTIEHEATTGKISEQTLFFLQSRGLNTEQAISLFISGFCSDVLENLPFEFAVEAKKLLQVNMEGSVG
jgi:SUF system FeS cluster assembly, SufBD